MSDKRVIMLGNEAIARGAYEAGVKVSAAYPGTPSTEISEQIVKYKDDIYLDGENYKLKQKTLADIKDENEILVNELKYYIN